MTSLVINVPGEYISLGLVMQSALEQASKGKGKERHASEGEAYEDQIICEVARRVGLGYPLGQAVKKIYESQRIGGERGVAELLGALNYIAAAVIVMREGMETAPKAEGNAKGEVRLIFKSGDPVEWFSFGRKDAAADGWHPAFYLCKAGDLNYHIVQDIDGMYHVVNCANLRSPEAKAECCGALAKTFAKENQPEASAEPNFKPGDRVEVRAITSRELWEPATVVEVVDGSCRVEFVGGYRQLRPLRYVRPVPKAEGCEALVEKDAPQTPHELYGKIIASNPATFGHPCTPTGEELAEMAETAEEEGRG